MLGDIKTDQKQPRQQPDHAIIRIAMLDLVLYSQAGRVHCLPLPTQQSNQVDTPNIGHKYPQYLNIIESVLTDYHPRPNTKQVAEIHLLANAYRVNASDAIPDRVY